MKYFVVSDIHSFYDELIAALDQAGFDSNVDTLVSLGDNFDRGYQTVKVFEYLKSLPNKILIRGNHENYLKELIQLKILREHDIHNKTIDSVYHFATMIDKDAPSYFAKAPELCGLAAQTDIIEFIDNMIDYYEIGDYVLVHGWIPTIANTYNTEWRNASPKMWYNAAQGRSIDRYKMGLTVPNKTIICGHWGTFNFKLDDDTPFDLIHDIYYGKDAIFIDATTALSRKVNVFVIESEK